MQAAENEPSYAATTAPADRSQEFVPVSGGEETASAAGLLIAAYLSMWAALLALVWTSWRRQRGIDRRLERLERSIEAADAEARQGAPGGPADATAP